MILPVYLFYGAYKGEKNMYRIYGKKRNMEYEMIKITEQLEEAQWIVNHNTQYLNILVIKREKNTDEVIYLENQEIQNKPKTKTLGINIRGKNEYR